MNRALALALSLLRSAAHMPDGIDRRFAVYLPDRTKDYQDTVLAFFYANQFGAA